MMLSMLTIHSVAARSFGVMRFTTSNAPCRPISSAPKAMNLMVCWGATLAKAWASSSSTPVPEALSSSPSSLGPPMLRSRSRSLLGMRESKCAPTMICLPEVPRLSAMTLVEISVRSSCTRSGLLVQLNV